MKIKDIVHEGRRGRLDKTKSQAMHRTHVYGDGYHTNGTMNFYRVGMAAAMADGSGKPLEIDDRTWYSTNNVSNPYTELEHRMMHQAFKHVKSDVEEVVKDHRSRESKDTHKNSPVPARKKNKYGV
jgi:hypothetical protein